MFRALIVAAVSTGAQASEEKYSLPQQIEACSEVCEARGWRIVGTIQIRGHSRYYNWLHEIIRDCPEYGEMVSLIEGSRIDLVVVRDYDRLWRTDALRAQVAALCREHGVQVFSLNQPVEPEDPAHLQDSTDSRLIVEALSGIIGQQENRARVRRLRLGMAGRIRRGLHHSGGYPPYGYRRDGEGLLMPDEEEAPWLRQIFQRYLAGRGMRGIAQELTDMGIPPPGVKRPTIPNAVGYWRYQSVGDILRNPVYKGEAYWGEFHNPDGQHQALVEAGDFDRVQTILSERGRFRDRPQDAERVLRGLLRCDFCDHAMSYLRLGGRLYLRCGLYGSTSGRRCQCNGHTAHRVHGYVLAQVQQLLRDPEEFLHIREEERQSEEARSELEAIDRQLAEADRRYARWNLLYEEEKINADELLMHRQRVHGRTDRLQSQRDELLGQVADETRFKEVLADLSELVGQVADMPSDELRELIYAPLIRRVVLKRGSLPRVVWWL